MLRHFKVLWKSRSLARGEHLRCHLLSGCWSIASIIGFVDEFIERQSVTRSLLKSCGSWGDASIGVIELILEPQTQ